MPAACQIDSGTREESLPDGVNRAGRAASPRHSMLRSQAGIRARENLIRRLPGRTSPSGWKPSCCRLPWWTHARLPLRGQHRHFTCFPFNPAAAYRRRAPGIRARSAGCLRMARRCELADCKPPARANVKFSAPGQSFKNRRASAPSHPAAEDARECSPRPHAVRGPDAKSLSNLPVSS